MVNGFRVVVKSLHIKIFTEDRRKVPVEAVYIHQSQYAGINLQCGSLLMPLCVYQTKKLLHNVIYFERRQEKIKA